MATDQASYCPGSGTLAREGNPQAQRLQPVDRDELDQAPLVEYGELATLRTAITDLLSQEHGFGDRSVFGILLEPRDHSYATNWHRDWRDNIEGLDRERWWRCFHNDDHFNQINCALYDDDCLWVVPGSHLRGDTSGEVARFPHRPVPHPELEHAQDDDDRYQRCIAYALSMPGAVNLQLKAGDFCLYRNTLWHMGCYRPDKIRATIHDGQMTPAFRTFMAESRQDLAERKAQGLGWSAYKHEYVDNTPPLSGRL